MMSETVSILFTKTFPTTKAVPVRISIHKHVLNEGEKKKRREENMKEERKRREQRKEGEKPHGINMMFSGSRIQLSIIRN